LLKDAARSQEVTWEDKMESTLTTDDRSMQISDPPPIGLHVMVDPKWSDLVKNLLKNLKEERITVEQGIFERS
jgi:hypothetical protein